MLAISCGCTVAPSSIAVDGENRPVSGVQTWPCGVGVVARPGDVEAVERVAGGGRSRSGRRPVTAKRSKVIVIGGAPLFWSMIPALAWVAKNAPDLRDPSA